MDSHQNLGLNVQAIHDFCIFPALQPPLESRRAIENLSAWLTDRFPFATKNDATSASTPANSSDKSSVTSSAHRRSPYSEPRSSSGASSTTIRTPVVLEGIEDQEGEKGDWEQVENLLCLFGRD